MSRSHLEDHLVWQLRAIRLPPDDREALLIPGRRWRYDFVWWTPVKLVVEVEGGHWIGGRHTRGKGFDEDIAKYAAAMLAGYRVLRVTRTHIENGQAVTWIEQLLRQPEAA